MGADPGRVERCQPDGAIYGAVGPPDGGDTIAVVAEEIEIIAGDKATDCGVAFELNGNAHVKDAVLGARAGFEKESGALRGAVGGPQFAAMDRIDGGKKSSAREGNET